MFEFMCRVELAIVQGRLELAAILHVLRYVLEY